MILRTSDGSLIGGPEVPVGKLISIPGSPGPPGAPGSTWDGISDKPIGIANGVASLDGGGKVPIAQLPSSIMEYQGTWDASSNTPALTDGTGSTGDVYRVTVAATRNLGSGAIDFAVGDYAIYNGSIWEKSDTTDSVASVAGKTGVVTLVKADVGLGNVDNTSDATKNAAVATLTNKTISGSSNTLTNVSADSVVDGTTNKAYTATEKTKLSGIATGATANSSDATLLARANHTGTQTASTISDFSTAADARVTPALTNTASSATPTPAVANPNTQYNLTALATGATFGAPTGSPLGGWKLMIRVKDDGTARALAYNAIYRAIGVTLPTTTVVSKTLYLGCIYNAADSKWDVLAVGQEA